MQKIETMNLGLLNALNMVTDKKATSVCVALREMSNDASWLLVCVNPCTVWSNSSGHKLMVSGAAITTINA